MWTICIICDGQATRFFECTTNREVLAFLDDIPLALWHTVIITQRRQNAE